MLLVSLPQRDEGPGSGGEGGPQTGGQPSRCANAGRTEIRGAPFQESQTLKSLTAVDCFAPAVLFLHSIFKCEACSFVVGGQGPSAARRAASPTVEIETLWIVLYTFLWWLTLNLWIYVGIPLNSFCCATPIWFGSDFIIPSFI